MEMFTIVAYCASYDMLKKLGIKDAPQAKVSRAQIMTTVLVAARFFQGSHKQAQQFLYEHKYFYSKLSCSQFCRRLHEIPDQVFSGIQKLFNAYAHQVNESFEYAIDSFPVAVCDNIRAQRSKILPDKKYRGPIPSKRRYFHGVRVHMIATMKKMPVEFKILPANASDITVAKKDLQFSLPYGSTIYGDKMYNDKSLEKSLYLSKKIQLMPIKKNNDKNPRSPLVEKIVRTKRKIIESTFSSINQLFPKCIHAVTKKGFLKKITSFVLAYSIERVVQTTT